MHALLLDQAPDIANDKRRAGVRRPLLAIQSRVHAELGQHMDGAPVALGTQHILCFFVSGDGAGSVGQVVALKGAEMEVDSAAAGSAR